MLKCAFSALAGLCLLGSVAQAGYHGISVDDVAQLDILPGWRTEDGTHMTALRIRLAPGWKTYWRAPGEAGIPPRFDWRGSRNLSAVAFHWPTPKVFLTNGMRTVGYERELVLPMELTPKSTGGEIKLKARVELGVCEDICVPIQVRVSANLPEAGSSDIRIVSAIDAAPHSAREAGLKSAKCSVEPIADGLRVTAHLDLPQMGGDEVAVIEHPDQTIWVSQAEANRTGRMLRAVAEMVGPSNEPFALDRSQLRITVLGGGRAVDIWGCTG